MEYKNLRVALDGPSGAGKSTVAKAVAQKTGLIYVDTGSLYRTVGLYMIEHGIASDDEQAIIAALPNVEVEMKYENEVQAVYLCGEAVGDKIRTEEASHYASAVSKIPEVRDFLFRTQRAMAERGGVIMDGRDIGTVIMPDAEIKVFMTATAEERARRRHREQLERGITATYEEVLENIKERDHRDSTREAAPLKAAEDAYIFINDGYEVEGSADYVVALMDKYIEERIES